MFELLFGLIRRVHRVHHFGDIFLLLSLPGMIRRLEYDDIEDREDPRDEERKKDGDLGTSGERRHGIVDKDSK